MVYYTRGEMNFFFFLSEFTIIAWITDTNDHYSISSYYFNTGLAVVSQCSKKQDIVALLSTKVEYVAVITAT